MPMQISKSGSELHPRERNREHGFAQVNIPGQFMGIHHFKNHSTQMSVELFICPESLWRNFVKLTKNVSLRG